jgi:translation initiation factor 3 subunit C
MSRFFRKADDSDSDTESSSEEELMSSDDEAPKPAASRLLQTGSDDSDSESDEESSSEEEIMSEGEDKGKKKSRFLVTEKPDEDSDEDGGKRIVKSARDKRLEEMETSGKQMDNALKINDWVAISNGAHYSRFLSSHPSDPLCRV